MRKISVFFLVVMLSFCFLSYAQAAPKVILDGKSISFDVQPVIDNGRTLVPLRAIFEALGAQVEWNGNTKTVSAISGDTTITLTIDQAVAYKNNDKVILEVPAKLVNERTMVPLRFVAESLGTTVSWDANNETINISSSKKPSASGLSSPTVDNEVQSNTSTKLAAGGSYSLAIKEDGTLWVWGDNWAGQLGDGTKTGRLTPVQVMSGVKSIVAGGSHTLAIKEDGTLWVWGFNADGQLGDGTSTDRLIPVQLMSGVMTVAAGDYHTLAIKEDGTLWAWGYNPDGQLGDGTTTITGRTTPVQVMSGIKSIAAGVDHSLAIKEDGTLWAWGNNVYGQLGDGTTASKKTPVQVMSDVKSVAAAGETAMGGDYSLAIKEDGTLWAWGNNEYGQLGDGSAIGYGVYKATPVQIMNGVKSVVAGGLYTLAIKEDGTLWAWGINNYGQLGDGTSTVKGTPVQVMSSVKSVVAGFSHTLAIKEDGMLWAWGENWAGQLGDGSTSNNLIPVQIMRVSPEQ